MPTALSTSVLLRSFVRTSSASVPLCAPLTIIWAQAPSHEKKKKKELVRVGATAGLWWHSRPWRSPAQPGRHCGREPFPPLFSSSPLVRASLFCGRTATSIGAGTGTAAGWAQPLFPFWGGVLRPKQDKMFSRFA